MPIRKKFRRLLMKEWRALLGDMQSTTLRIVVRKFADRMIINTLFGSDSGVCQVL